MLCSNKFDCRNPNGIIKFRNELRLKFFETQNSHCPKMPRIRELRGNYCK
jgi:hypothetical protein